MSDQSKVITAPLPIDLADQVDGRHRMTLMALIDVDAGRVIDAAQIKAWAESLSTKAPLPLPAELQRRTCH